MPIKQIAEMVSKKVRIFWYTCVVWSVSSSLCSIQRPRNSMTPSVIVSLKLLQLILIQAMRWNSRIFVLGKYRCDAVQKPKVSVQYSHLCAFAF